MIDETVNMSPEKYSGDFSADLLEQYKLYVEMADRNSGRRQTANSFFASTSSIILTAAGVLASLEGVELSPKWVVPVCTAGIILSITWWLTIRSYRLLSDSKFKVVHKMERLLPTSPYQVEWRELGEGKSWSRYQPASHIEQWVPGLFVAVYVGILLTAFL